MRSLNLHEHVAAGLLRDHGVMVPRGKVVSSPEDGFYHASKAGYNDFVVKAQVLSGGRKLGHFTSGLKSGVHLSYSPEGVRDLCSQMLGSRLVTKQTGPEGLPCNSVYICERLYPRKEHYIAFTLCRKTAKVVLVGSSMGGVNIEETSHSNPDSISKLALNIDEEISHEKAIEFLKSIKFSEEVISKGAHALQKLFKIFNSTDLTLLEINPFCETIDGHVVCMDCKIQVDDNALYRQEKLRASRDYTQEQELDAIADKHGINYIGLDGTIGCLVNGAGLAMATMDIIRLHGGTPANFLDVGGGASSEQVVEAFRIILSDKKAILVNIFGGIMRCDVIAEGIIKAAKDLNIRVPMVVRLQGTNVEEAEVLFAESNLRIFAFKDLDEATRMVVSFASIVELAHKDNINVSFELPI